MATPRLRSGTVIIRRGFARRFGLVLPNPYNDDNYLYRNIIWDDGCVTFEHIDDLIDVKLLVPNVD